MSLKSAYRTFSQVLKNEPSVSDVHVPADLGRRRRSRSFSQIVGPLPESSLQVFRDKFGYDPDRGVAKRYGSIDELPAAVRDKLKDKPKKLRRWMHVWNSSFDEHGDEARAFASAWASVKKRSGEEVSRDAFGYDVRVGKVIGGVRRQLEPIGKGKYSRPPFFYDAEFIKSVTADQVPRLLYALTHRGEIEKRTVSIADLAAIQDRVKTASVVKFRKRTPKSLPLVVRKGGRDYIADGHSRLTAKWLTGLDLARVHFYDLGDRPSLAMKRLADAKITFEVKKADPDQRLVFGWASVVTKDGRPIIDHQGDVIPVDELEKAFYEYVLTERNHGHMHRAVSGRLVECMVFTKEKQDLLKIVIRDDDGDQIEAAWVGYLVDDPSVWAAHKRGELPEFSIGGAAVPIPTEMSLA